ncbi:MAG TPA: RidA family protein [Agriterribacter sp.]|nr:RidA family protein [Agriterribacter sp.]
MKTKRRFALKQLLASAVGLFGIGLSASALTSEKEEKKVYNIQTEQDVPLFSASTTFGGLVFISGQGAHYEGDIKAHTETVLKALEKELINAGSTMKKVLKVNVYLNDIADFKGMNEVYKGRFGPHPPVRTTVAVAKGGVPGDSLVEMDCIAHL